MALTRDFKETVVERARRDAKFREAMFTEALNACLAGDTRMAPDLIGAGRVLPRRPCGREYRVTFAAAGSQVVDTRPFHRQKRLPSGSRLPSLIIVPEAGLGQPRAYVASSGME